MIVSLSEYYSENILQASGSMLTPQIIFKPKFTYLKLYINNGTQKNLYQRWEQHCTVTSLAAEIVYA
jgi:hypothetical protein